MRFRKLADLVGMSSCMRRRHGVRPACAAAWGPSLNDAPAAFHRSLTRYLLNSELSTKCIALRCQASTFDPCLLLVFRDHGQAVGAFTAHIDDILRCGEPDVPIEPRLFFGIALWNPGFAGEFGCARGCGIGAG